MKARHVGLSAVLVIVCAMTAGARELTAIELPAPETRAGRPLMAALQDRQSQRSFSSRTLPDQVLANLLWAAFGVNRPDSGKRTAPSARNWQEIDVYAALPRGLFRYDAPGNRLEPVKAEDIRAITGRQRFTEDAPVCLVYVADRSRMGGADEEQKDFYAAVDTGFISQNVYLFAASEGLATVVLGLVDKPALAEAMGLRDDQEVILTQPVGYPE